MSDFKSIFKRRLRIAMAESGMDTAQDLADASGLSTASIHKYMRGETAPTLETAMTLSDALGVTPNDLCGVSK